MSEGAAEVPVTRLTVIRPERFTSPDDAASWLGETTGSEERRDRLVAEALAIVNRALHMHGVALQNPEQGGLTTSDPLTTRIGFGSGDEVADGRWQEAVEVPPEAGRLSRSEALRPQERLAAALGGRERQAACETLVLRARSDLDAGRAREAALQLRVALEALLVEIPADEPETSVGGLAGEQAKAQLADLAELEARRSATGAAANEALAGELTEGTASEVAETVRLCERVLRRRRLLRA